MTHEESGAQFAAAQHLKTVELQAIAIKAKDDEIARLGIVVADQRATIAGMVAPAAPSLRAAAAEVLKHRHGTLPTCGRLRDNDASRKALDGLACALAAPAAPSEQAEPDEAPFLKHWDSVSHDYGFGIEFSAAYRAARAAWFAAAAPAAPLPAQPEQSAPTDMSHHLRHIAAVTPDGAMSQLSTKTVLAAADEIERYYGGMLAWKQTAEKKDRDWNEERMARVNERCEARSVLAVDRNALMEEAAAWCDLVGKDWDEAGDYIKFHAATYLAKGIRERKSTAPTITPATTEQSSIPGAAPLPELTGPSAFLADLQAIDIAMHHMGDTLNEMDVVDDVDEAIAAPGFAALAKLLSAAASPSPAPAPQVGCERADGLLNIHAESSTCEVCAPLVAAPVSQPIVASTAHAVLVLRQISRLNPENYTHNASAIIIAREGLAAAEAAPESPKGITLQFSGVVCEVGDLEGEGGLHGIIIRRRAPGDYVTIKGLTMEETRALCIGHFMDEINVSLGTVPVDQSSTPGAARQGGDTKTSGAESSPASRMGGIASKASAESAQQQDPSADHKDAERYRWLRDPRADIALVIDKRTNWVPPDEALPGIGGYWQYEYRSGKELDSAIDNALAGRCIAQFSATKSSESAETAAPGASTEGKQ